MSGDEEVGYGVGFQSLGHPIDDAEVDWREIGSTCLVCDADATTGERRLSRGHGGRPIAIPRYFRICAACVAASRLGVDELLARLPDGIRTSGEDDHFVALVREADVVTD